MAENSFNLWLDKPRIYSVVFIYITKAMTKTVAIDDSREPGRVGAGIRIRMREDHFRAADRKPSSQPKAAKTVSRLLPDLLRYGRAYETGASMVL